LGKIFTSHEELDPGSRPGTRDETRDGTRDETRDETKDEGGMKWRVA